MPHIYANDTRGLFYGYGYAVAEDRLFQMEMARRSVLGTVKCSGRAMWRLIGVASSLHTRFDPGPACAALGRRSRDLRRLRGRLQRPRHSGARRQGELHAEA